MDLLKLHEPWDCQRFPKSKTICYAGGGLGGGNPNIKMPDSIADTSLASIADVGTNITDTLKEAKLPESAFDIKMPTSIADTSLGGIDLSVKGLEEGIKKKGSMISEGWEQKKASAQNIKEDISEGIEKKKKSFGEGWEQTKERAQGIKDKWADDIKRSDFGKVGDLVEEFVHNPGETLAKSDLGKVLGADVGTVSGALPGEEGSAKGKGIATGTGLSDLQKSQLAKRRQGYGRRQTFLT